VFRLFIAVSLTAEQVDQVTVFQNQLKHTLKGVRWVKPDGMHLTLAFIGEAEQDKLDAVKEVIDRVKVPFNSFKFNISGSGVFPTPSRARVLWLGVGEGKEELTLLAENMAAGLVVIGLKEEKRKYQPHLTIGRIRQPLEENKIRDIFLARNDFKTSTAVVDHLELFESRLSRHGAEYRSLYRKKFIH
jgi:2'-5' RNA ligase